MNKKETEVILQRIQKWYDRLPGLLIYDQRNFDAKYGWSKEPKPFNDRHSLDYRSIKEGDEWGGKWESAWFHLTGSCLLYTSPSPRDLSTSRMPSSA